MDKFLTSGTVSELCSNKVMLCAVLEYVYGLAYPVKIDGKEFEDIDVEFAYQLANRFDFTMLILEENKRSIMYGIADSPEKPYMVNPEEYYNGLVTLVDVLHKLTGNFDETQKASAYEAYKVNPVCDIILYYAVGEYMEEEFWDGEVDRISTESLEEFCKGLREHIAYYFKEEAADAITKELLSYWENEQKENPDIFEEDEDEMVSYGWQLREVFSPEHIFSNIEEFLDIL